MISVLPGQVKAKAMDIPYDHAAKIKLNQRPVAPSEKQVESADAWILWVPESGRILWKALPWGELIQSRWRRRCASEQKLVTDLPTQRGTRLVAMRLPRDADGFTRLSRAREAVADCLCCHPGHVITHAMGTDSGFARDTTAATIAALWAATAPLPDLKQKPDEPQPLRRIDCFGVSPALDTTRLLAASQGNHLARWLTRLPPNELTPSHYRQTIERLARIHGWDFEFLDRAALARRKAGAFLAVARASADQNVGIAHLHYGGPRGRRGRAGALSLVGKGICFDTGGINLKPARSMLGMHEDMQGSAVALGTLLALTLLQVDFPVDCWLAITDNQPGPEAYKPNDVVRAANGTSIEIVHTDAEGRMVLADTLALAARRKPRLIIDYATLTGACVYALSSRYSGALTNRRDWEPRLVAAGRDSGERVWPFPMDADFDETLKSDIADVKQCTLDSEADQILAARFLNRFVPEEIPWIHLDLAAGNHKGGLAHIPSDTTGFGVHLTLELLFGQHLLDEARDA